MIKICRSLASLRNCGKPIRAFILFLSISFYFDEHGLALVAVVDDLHQAVEGAAAVGDLADFGVAAHEDAALSVLGGVAAVDADALVVGHADEQWKPALEPWTHRHHYRVTAFGNGGLALGLAAAVVEVDPMGLKGVTEIGPRSVCPALTAADTEAADGVGRSLRDAFQMEFYHDYKTLPASLKGRRIALPKRREGFFNGLNN